MRLSNDPTALYAAICAADDAQDPDSLARLCWHLYELVTTTQAERDDKLAAAVQLGSAARAVVASGGSTAALESLRHALLRLGWEPSAGASPLQVLAYVPAT